jgi:hypothetical protein
VFDCCAGWGDRAIAAMSRSYVKQYEGCEPNIKSQQGIANAIQVFGNGKEHNVHLTGFEDFDFEDKYYDMVFTSPPFFDVEVYCNMDTQSIVRYPTQDVWYEEFLLPMFLRCWECIKPHGHLVISINNARDRRSGKLRFYCTERLVHDLTNMCQNATFLGVVCYGDNEHKRMEPIFIWRKDQDTYPAKHIRRKADVLKPQWERELKRQHAPKELYAQFTGLLVPSTPREVRDIVRANIFRLKTTS